MPKTVTLKLPDRNLQTLARFMNKVSLSPTRFYNGTPCWEWQAFCNSAGYGMFWFVDCMRLAHRVFVRLLGETISIPGSVNEPRDHLCRNPRCVNNAHTEDVTPQINALRGISFTAQNAAKTECLRGHPLSEENIDYSKSGSRICRTCDKARKRESRKRRRQHRLEYDRQWRARQPDYYHRQWLKEKARSEAKS